MTAAQSFLFITRDCYIYCIPPSFQFCLQCDVSASTHTADGRPPAGLSLRPSKVPPAFSPLLLTVICVSSRGLLRSWEYVLICRGQIQREGRLWKQSYNHTWLDTLYQERPVGFVQYQDETASFQISREEGIYGRQPLLRLFQSLYTVLPDVWNTGSALVLSFCRLPFRGSFSSDCQPSLKCLHRLQPDPCSHRLP